MGLFQKLKEGLKKTRDGIMGQIDALFKRFTKVDEELFEELEELLIAADVGMLTSEKICDTLRDKVKKTGTKEPQEVRGLLIETIAEMLEGDMELKLDTKPSIILVIGVNGVGKTTTIGKLCSKFRKEGKKVVIAAADTFRAAAIDQLEIWAERAKCDIVKHTEGSDPAAVIFDGVSAAKARKADILICDTAGRLHNKKHLMDELAKINRVFDREAPDCSREVLLVLDATTGQNAINQARAFKDTAGLTGIILTKLDGTARGGVVLAIKEELGVPVKFIGVGEKIEDLQPFDPKAFAAALFDNADKVGDFEIKLGHEDDASDEEDDE
ncbi:MAG: signal recognition particle-docking protein FtsY [Acutalibacteraceae bacterium]